MFRIYFSKENRTVQAQAGESLLAVMQRSGIGTYAACGGRGTCGKCRVLVDGELQLACQTRVDRDLTVETSEAEKGLQMAAGEAGTENAGDPVLRTEKVRLTKPVTGDGRSEWERLLEEIRRSGKIEVSGIRTDLELASGLYEKRMLQEDWYAAFTRDRILEISPEKPDLYLIAFDLGTTTIAGTLLSGDGCKRLATASCLNPQSLYGADVVTRMDYAQQKGNHELKNGVTKALKALTQELCEEAGIRTEQIAEMVIAANTCMQHLLLGLSVSSLALAPYVPAVGGPLSLDPGELGLRIHPKGRICFPGNLSGYIGGDIMAGLLVLRPDLEPEPVLFLDIGTNTEMVLGDHTGLLCASAASGPAFEGAGITCGMLGAFGAVDHVFYTDGKWSYTTIGGGPAKGLCGSGLIDLIACLSEAGLLDEMGILDSGQADPQCFMLAGPEEAAVHTGVYITQKDISQLQMAKAAIAAGIRLLMAQKGVRAGDITRIELAGGFGSYINPQNAARIGMIPAKLADRCRALGNTALQGAVHLLARESARKEEEKLRQKAAFLELASLEDFQDAFIDALSFEPMQEE